MIRFIVSRLCLKFLSRFEIGILYNIAKREEEAKVGLDPVCNAILIRNVPTKSGTVRRLTSQEEEIIKQADVKRATRINVFYTFPELRKIDE